VAETEGGLGVVVVIEADKVALAVMVGQDVGTDNK